MQIIYKKRIVDLIDTAIDEAERLGKEIDRIVLSEEEWEQFCDELRHLFPPRRDARENQRRHDCILLGLYRGVPIIMSVNQ